MSLRLQSLDLPPTARRYLRDAYVVSGGVEYALEDRFYAHGELELVFNVGLRFHEGDEVTSARVLGQITRPLPARVSGEGLSLGGTLTPAGAGALLGRSAGRLGGGHASLRELGAGAMAARLTRQLGHGDIDAAAALLPAVFAEADRLRRTDARHARQLGKALEVLGDGHSSAAVLAAALGVSPRHLLKLFRERLGLTVSQYRRVRRFAGAVARIDRGGFGRLTDLAYASGYADQAHLGRDVRYFAELTPGQVAAARRPVASLYTGLGGA